MRLDRRFFVVLSISLVWALVVSAMFYRLASGAATRRRPEARKSMVIASKALPLGATVGRESVELREVPEDFFPIGAFSRIEDVIDRPVISPIQPDEPVVAARLAEKGSGMGLAPLIPSGMRALSIRVNDVVGVSGFILPGMRVDILVTGRPPEGRSETITRTVLQNIAVLSAGQTLQVDGKSQSIQVPVVTLLVTPHEAEALTLANNEGRVQLVLRNSGDALPAVTPGSRLSDLYNGSTNPVAEAADARLFAARLAVPVRPAPEMLVRPPAPAPAPRPVVAAPPAPPPAVKAEPKPATDEIEVIHGKVKTIEVFAKGGVSK